MKIALIGCAALAVLAVAVLVAVHAKKVCRTTTVFLDHY